MADFINSQENAIQVDLLRPILKYWRRICLGAIIGIIIALTYEMLSIAKYTATVALVPAANQTDPSNVRIDGLSALSSLTGGKLGKSDKVSNIERFTFLLNSVRLAEWQITHRRMLQVLYPEKWNSVQNNWHHPTGPFQWISEKIRQQFDLPAWVPPNKYSIVETYKLNLKQMKDGDTEIMRITYSDPNPNRAASVLEAIVTDTNNIVRQDAVARATEYAGYLRQKLQTNTIQEYRGTLLALLSQQEQTLMLASSKSAFVAEPIEAYSVSAIPTSKKPVSFAFLGFLLGALSSYAISAIVYNSRQNKNNIHNI